MATAQRTSTSPVVLSVTEPLTAKRARELAIEIVDLDPKSVVVDLTGMPFFDSDGVSLLVDLQDQRGSDRLAFRGMVAAVSRLVNAPELRGLRDPEVDQSRVSNAEVVRLHAGHPHDVEELSSKLAEAVAARPAT